MKSPLFESPLAISRLTQVGLGVSSLCLFLSLVSFRAVLIRQFQIPLDSIWKLGFLSGILNDLSLTVFVFAISLTISSLHPRLRNLTQTFGWTFLYLLTFANACYVLYFMQPLDWSAVKNGGSNIWEIRGVLKHFFKFVFIQVSLILFGMGIWIQLYCISKIETASKKFRLQNGIKFWRRASAGVGLILLAWAFKQAPIWLRIPRLQESPLAQSPALVWLKSSMQGAEANHSVALTSAHLTESRQLLKRFSRMTGDQFPPSLDPSETASLVRSLSIPPEHTQELRQEFGLPTQGKLNVILIFMEAARAFEFFHPEIGPEVYPNLRRIFNKQGLLFSQAYTAAKYTVEGQFTTLCSNLDRMEGPPIYSSVPYLKTTCLPSLFVQNGYRTYWMNPFSKDFAGKYVFEINHGTQEFFDRNVFKSKSPNEELNSTEWGVSDHVFLDQAFSQLSEIHQKGKPFFAHLLTTGTHIPWREFENFQIKEPLDHLTQSSPNHHAYLSSVKAFDSAIGQFLDKFFQSPMADNTIVFLASDHGTGIFPGYPAPQKWQKRLLWPRVILGAVTRNRKTPKKIPYPVNQLDMAPLIAAVTGLQGQVSWLGKDPTLGSGTPWISRLNHEVSYRTQSQLCIYDTSEEKRICRHAPPEADPLMDLSLLPGKENLELTHELTKVIQANEDLLNSGRIMD